MTDKRDNDIVDYSIYRYNGEAKRLYENKNEVECEIVDDYEVKENTNTLFEYDDSISVDNLPTKSDLLPKVVANEVAINQKREILLVDKVKKSINNIDFKPNEDIKVQTNYVYKGNKYKGSKKVKKRKFTLAIVSVLACFILVILLADTLSNGYIISKVAGIFNGTNNQKVYYAVELASFTDMNSARLMSSEVREGGAGGYVINDELYRVIAEVYEDKKDAISVSQKLNLDGYITSIYEIKINTIDYKLFPQSTRNPTKDAMNYYSITYASLYDIALKIDEGTIDYANSRGAISTLVKELKNLLVDYEANVDNELDNENVVKVRAQINGIVGAVSNILTESDNIRDMVSDIRYVNTMVLNTHSALVRSLSGN